MKNRYNSAPQSRPHAMHIPSRYLYILPLFTAFAAAALIIARFGLHANAIALILGVIAGGLVDMDHHAGGRMKNLVPILIAFTLCALAVQHLRGHAVLLILFLTLLAFAATMLAALDARYRTVGFCTLVVALYTLLSNGAHGSYLNPFTIICGTLLCQGSILLFQLAFPNRPVQDSLAASYTALADYIEGKARFFAPDEQDALLSAEYELVRKTGLVAQAFNHTRDVLFKRLASQQAVSRRARQLNEFFTAQDLHERISAAHVDYIDLHQRLAHSDILFRIERLLILQAQVCREYAHTLARETPYHTPAWLTRADLGLQNAWQHYRAIHAGQDNDDIESLLANLHQASARLQTLGQDTPPPPDSALADSNLKYRGIPARLREHGKPQSPVFRHAVRMAAATFICALLAEILGMAQGYWILLTAVFVCQPNRSATRAKLIQRIIGTLLGVVAGSLLPHIAPEPVSLLSLIVAANTAFFYFRARNYSYSTFFITIQIFLGFAYIGMDTGSAVWQRVFDTLLGAAIAWGCVNLIYPDQRYQSPARLLKQALTANATYLGHILQQTPDNLAYRGARRRVHESAAALAALAEENRSVALATIVQDNYRIVAQLSALAARREQLPARAGGSGETLQALMQSLGEAPPDWAMRQQHLEGALYNQPRALQRINQRLADIHQVLPQLQADFAAPQRASGLGER